MLHGVKKLTGFTIGATDGEIGTVRDIYFDDATWKVRYLVVETGNWLFGRKILLSPVAVQSIGWDAKTIRVNLTTDQVKHSPDIDTDKPVSVQQEAELHKHYLWPQDGGGFGFMTTGMVGGVIAPGIPFDERITSHLDDDRTPSERISEEEIPGDRHLRSFKGTTGYSIHATDDVLGEVSDFLIDDSTWDIPYAVIETGNWFSGKKIITPTSGISQIEWANSAVYINQTIGSLKDMSEFRYEELSDQNFGSKY